MARAQKRRTIKKKAQKNRGWFSRTAIKKIVYTFFLLTFLVFSVGFLTYVVFFRIVVAAETQPPLELEISIQQYGPDVISESGVEGGQERVPQCAIIIDDMGYHLDIGKEMIDLPLNLSFSFLPHAPFTPELEKMAYERGRTILLHLPLQPKDEAWDPVPAPCM